MPGVWQTLSHCQLLLLLVTEQLLLEEQVSMKPWTGFSDVRVKKTSPLHYSLEQGQESFSMKGQKVSILGFVGHTVSLTTPQFCCYILKAAIYKI